MELRNYITKGGVIKITGELLCHILDLPEDAKILKIIASKHNDYCFDVVFFSGEGMEIAEANQFPIMKKNDLAGVE